MKKITCLLTCILLSILYGFAVADTDIFVLQAQNGTVELLPTELEEEHWLFLPAFAAQNDLSLPDGELRWGEAEGDVYPLEIWHGGQCSDTYNVMFSQNLRSLFLFSDDPAQQGRSYIENSEKHTTFTTASMALVSAQGHVDHSGSISKLRGRGNGTWSAVKKAYQFKLTDRADLLDTHIPDERNRTWLLLADAFDPSLLHNRVTFDLALELGMERTSRSEHVDLYYDGEYRGTYLLCEKVEIGPGRIDESDFDKLIANWNAQIGQSNLESLPVITAQNRFGQQYHYVDGVADNQTPDAGAYLLELESAATLSNPCYFTYDNGRMLALKNPEFASEAMMRYISEQLESARHTLNFNNLDPETGRSAQEAFNIDGFARVALLDELCYNPDGFDYSSAFFLLPAGASRFEPGTVWDFDLAYRYQRNGTNPNGRMFKDLGGWLWDFYQTPAFITAMQKIYAQELYPLMRNVLLGNERGTYLRPIDEYEAEIAASRRMNERLHGLNGHTRLVNGESGEADTLLMKRFLDERSEWLLNALMSARCDADHVALWFDCCYLELENEKAHRMVAAPWSHVQVTAYDLVKLCDADEENYALWQLNIDVAPLEGLTFVDPTVTVNDTAVGYERLSDGQLRVSVTFEDPSYRPVDAYGEDIGMVYDYETYVTRYPEVLEECEGDPELVLDYFLYDGMYEGHCANAFFDPHEILLFNPLLCDVLGEDWQMYYWDFISYGYGDGWLKSLGRRFMPDVADAD